MANTTTSPNMGMPVPVVGTDPGPDWANNINACLSIIDSHNHSTGQGAPVTGPIIGSTIDNSIIGGTTPANATFSEAKIGTSGFFFKTQKFSGSLAPSGTATLLSALSIASFVGAIGVTTYAGGTNFYLIGTGYFTASSTSTCYVFLDNVGVKVVNNDNANSNSYIVVVFYF